MNNEKMMPEVSGQLANFALRLEGDRDFMASALAAYREREKLNDQALAKQLGATDVTLLRLALCKRPDSASPQFAAQVREIAEYVGVDAPQLSNLLRQVEILEQLAKQPGTGKAKETEAQQTSFRSGLLAAARDREEKDEDTDSATDTKDVTKSV